MNETRIIARAQASVMAEAFGGRASFFTRASLHAPHGVALYAGLEAPLTVRTAAGIVVRARVVAVSSHQAHSVESTGSTLELLYDPVAASAITRFAREHGTAFPLETPLARFVLEQSWSHRVQLRSADVLAGMAHETAQRLASGHAPFPIDRRVARALEHLHASDPERPLEPLRGISAAHLSALFTRDVGLPLRAYRLWRRMVIGLAACTRLDITAAAHDAGFADLGHFSRTCRRFLGRSPRELRNDLLA